MLPERHKDVSWASGLTLIGAFLPIAVLVGYIPGLWWWIGAALTMVAFLSALWFVAGREERLRAAIGALTSRNMAAPAVALATAIVTGLAVGVAGASGPRERAHLNAPTPVLVCRDGKWTPTTKPRHVVALLEARGLLPRLSARVRSFRTYRCPAEVLTVGPVACR